MLSVLIPICVLLRFAGGDSYTRLEDKLNSVRKDISYLYEDMSMLSRDIKNINKTVWVKNGDGSMDKNNELGRHEQKITVSKVSVGNDKQTSFVEIAQLLEAFESEKRLNRKLQNQIQQLQDRMETTENKYVGFEAAIESEKIQNKNFQTRIHIQEEQNTKIEHILDSKRRLETLEKKNSEIDKLNLELNSRLDALENKIVEISKSVEYIDQLESRVMDRLKKLDNSNADLKEEFEAEKQLYKNLLTHFGAMEDNIGEMYEEVAQNISSLVECSHCIHVEATPRISKKPDSTSTLFEATTMDNVLESCHDVKSSGVYEVFFSFIGTTKSVYCDADTDGGGWIVTMRRQDGSVNFTRSWNDYKHGFGDVDGEFWIGNDVLHELTKSKPLQLRVDMEDFDGNKAYAMYDRFQIGSEADKYILSVSDYSGTAGDSFGEADGEGGIINSMKFTTFDSINERSRTGYCVKRYPGGWWFNYCFNSHLTAKYRHNGYIRGWHGILWYSWLGQFKSLKFVEMKLR